MRRHRSWGYRVTVAERSESAAQRHARERRAPLQQGCRQLGAEEAVLQVAQPRATRRQRKQGPFCRAHQGLQRRRQPCRAHRGPQRHGPGPAPPAPPQAASLARETGAATKVAGARLIAAPAGSRARSLQSPQQAQATELEPRPAAAETVAWQLSQQPGGQPGAFCSAACPPEWGLGSWSAAWPPRGRRSSEGCRDRAPDVQGCGICTAGQARGGRRFVERKGACSLSRRAAVHALPSQRRSAPAPVAARRPPRPLLYTEAALDARDDGAEEARGGVLVVAVARREHDGHVPGMLVLESEEVQRGLCARARAGGEGRRDRCVPGRSRLQGALRIFRTCNTWSVPISFPDTTPRWVFSTVYPAASQSSHMLLNMGGSEPTATRSATVSPGPPCKRAAIGAIREDGSPR